MADLTRQRSAVLLHRYPLCILAVEKVLGELGVDVAATTTDVDEALRLLSDSRPDIFVAGVDGSMAPPEQVDYVATARERSPEMKVIALSLDTDPGQIEAVLKAGAAAYVVETQADRDELEAAIRQAVEWLDVAAEGPPAPAR